MVRGDSSQGRVRLARLVPHVAVSLRRRWSRSRPARCRNIQNAEVFACLLALLACLLGWLASKPLIFRRFHTFKLCNGQHKAWICRGRGLATHGFFALRFSRSSDFTIFRDTLCFGYRLLPS